MTKELDEEGEQEVLIKLLSISTTLFHLHFQGDLVLVNDSAARLHKLAREKSDALVDEFVAKDEEGPMRSTRSRAAKK